MNTNKHELMLKEEVFDVVDVAESVAVETAMEKNYLLKNTSHG